MMGITLSLPMLLILHTLRVNTMNREQLAQVYLDWVNNYLTVERFAEHYGLHLYEAEDLLKLAKAVFNTPHPDA